MKALDLISKILVIVGGLNWGLVGIAKFDLVAAILGQGSLLSSIVYTLVGLAALVQIGSLVSICRFIHISVSSRLGLPSSHTPPSLR